MPVEPTLQGTDTLEGLASLEGLEVDVGNGMAAVAHSAGGFGKHGQKQTTEGSSDFALGLAAERARTMSGQTANCP